MLSRREFLRIGAVALGALALRELLPPAEVSAAGLAKGYLLDTSGQIQGEPVMIQSVDWNGNYLISEGNKQKKVPMVEVLIAEGYPWRNTGAYQNLGVRLDNAVDMEIVKRAGAGRIRARAVEGSIGAAETEFEKLMTAAEKAKVATLLVIDTNHPWEGENEDKLRQYIKSIFTFHPKTELEILNEIDDPNANRWEGRDFKTAAHFIKVVIETVNEVRWKKGYQTKLWLPALVDVANTPFFLQALKEELGDKLPLSKLYGVGQAMHFYPDLAADPKLDGIANAVWYVSDQFVKLTGWYPQIAVTEVGRQGTFRDRIEGTKFVEKCFQQPGVRQVYFHELINHTDGHPLDTEFGLVDHDGLAWPAYYYLAVLGRRLAGY